MQVNHTRHMNPIGNMLVSRLTSVSPTLPNVSSEGWFNMFTELTLYNIYAQNPHKKQGLGTVTCWNVGQGSYDTFLS